MKEDNHGGNISREIIKSGIVVSYYGLTHTSSLYRLYRFVSLSGRPANNFKSTVGI